MANMNKFDQIVKIIWEISTTICGQKMDDIRLVFSSLTICNGFWFGRTGNAEEEEEDLEVEFLFKQTGCFYSIIVFSNTHFYTICVFYIQNLTGYIHFACKSLIPLNEWLNDSSRGHFVKNKFLCGFTHFDKKNN